MAAPIAPNRDNRRLGEYNAPGGVQRVFNESRSWRIFAAGTTVATSWTTVLTGAKSATGVIRASKEKTVLTWISFVSTDASDYTLQLRLQDPAGTNYEIAQAQLVEDGEQWRPLRDGETLPLPSQWKLQMIGSGAGTVNVNWIIAGYTEEER